MTKKLDPQTVRANARASAQTTKRGLEWRCLTCGFSCPPDGPSYMQAIQPPCTGKRTVCLVNTETGEELAANAAQAQRLGLLPKKSKAKLPPPEPKQKMETPLPGDESIEGYEEREGGGEGNQPKTEETDTFVEGEPHWIKAKVSIKTLAYYEYTASRMNTGDGSKLTLGDFIDICVDDFFKGRNLSLGLVQLEEKKEG